MLWLQVFISAHGLLQTEVVFIVKADVLLIVALVRPAELVGQDSTERVSRSGVGQNPGWPTSIQPRVPADYINIGS